jgi:hypothetical protein
MRSIRALALATSAGGLTFATVAAFTGCSTSSSSGSASGGGVATSIPFAGPDVSLPPGAVLQPDVVVVHGGASALQAVSADHGVWTLNKSASGVSQITPGKVVLIAGLDCARATAVQDNGSTLDVTVEPVAFVDVLQEADVAWNDQMLDLSHGYLGQVPYATVVNSEQAPDAGADGACDGGRAGGDAGGGSGGDAGGDGGIGSCLRLQDDHAIGTGISLTIGKWTVSANVTTSSSAVDETLQATWNPQAPGGRPMPGDPAQTLGGVNVGFGLKMHVANVQGSSGSVSVHGGTITSASFNAPVGGSADLSVQASTPMGGQYPKQALLKIPLAVEWPIFWGPVPLYVYVQANLLVQPSLSTANATLGMTSHIDFSGNAGMMFSNGSVAGTSSPTATTPASPLNDLMAPPSVGTQAAVIAVEAPRVGVGIGTGAFGLGIKAGMFVDAVNSFGIVVASSTALVPCQAMTWDFGAQAGGEMKLLGTLGATTSVSLISSSATWNHQDWYTPMVAACKP